jgi:hypothetical protein
MDLISRRAFGEPDNKDRDDALYVNQILRFRAEIRPNWFRYPIRAFVFYLVILWCLRLLNMMIFVYLSDCV